MIYAIVGGLLIVGGLIALTVALVQRHVCAEVEPYHPLFAESPDPAPVQPVEPEPLIDWQRAKYFTGEEAVQLQATAPREVPYVVSDHPADCAKACCWEIRLAEMVNDFDWSAREHEMRSKR